MTRQRETRIWIGTALAIALAGCGGLETGLQPSLRRSALSFNWGSGWRLPLSGRDLNGTALNGVVLDGHLMSAISLAGVTAGGQALKKVWLQGTAFHTAGPGNAALGKDAVGAVFQGMLDDGTTIAVRIDGVGPGTTPKMADVLEYVVSYSTREGWRPLCGVSDDGAPVGAVPLAGRWNLEVDVPGSGSFIDDPASFTFACQGYALAKCVEAGYKPWLTGKSCTKGKCTTVSLADYHQACTRLLRADYCGDGRSHTVDGQELNMYDGFGIRTDAGAWLPEAEWDGKGARCVARQRIAGEVPSCLASLATEGCGDPSHFATGALLISELPPAL